MGSFYEYLTSRAVRFSLCQVATVPKATTHKQKPDKKVYDNCTPNTYTKTLRACLKTAAVVFAVWYVE